MATLSVRLLPIECCLTTEQVMWICAVPFNVIGKAAGCEKCARDGALKLGFSHVWIRFD